LVKADLLGFTRTDVEQAVLAGHARRRRNSGAGDWLLVAGRLAVVYKHPVSGDGLIALVVTLWRRP
jgi:hypothetical protein